MTKVDWNLHSETTSAMEQRLWRFLDPGYLEQGSKDHLGKKQKLVDFIYDRCAEESSKPMSATEPLEDNIDRHVETWLHCTEQIHSKIEFRRYEKSFQVAFDKAVDCF